MTSLGQVSVLSVISLPLTGLVYCIKKFDNFQECAKKSFNEFSTFSIDEGVSPEVMDILPEAPVQSEPEGSFVREIFDNYRSIASAILNAFGCRERFCADEKCSNLDGTALMIIHLLFIKILTGFALHWYKNDYTDKTKKFISEKVDEIKTKVSRSAESGWGN